MRGSETDIDLRTEEHAARLLVIRASVQRSLADTRPDVPPEDAFDRLARLHADTMKSA